MSKLFAEIYRALQSGKQLVTATIISGSGSIPRASGSKMIVYDDSSISGTIGGGVVEREIIDAAGDLFQTGTARVEVFGTDPHFDNNAQCGGKVQVLMEHIRPDDAAVERFRIICENLAGAHAFHMIGRLEAAGSNQIITWAIEKRLEAFIGDLAVSPELKRAVDEYRFGFNSASIIEHEKNAYIVSVIKPPDTVYLVGAGHVAKALAHFAAQVGFGAVVIDSRKALCTASRFPDASELRCCPDDFSNVFIGLPVAGNSSVVIMTYSHALDREVLAQALRTPAGYIGMLGSSRKKEAIYRSLLADGFTGEDLERVCCPIGLSIAAETPDEIGISIVGQLIQKRAGRSR